MQALAFGALKMESHSTATMDVSSDAFALEKHPTQITMGHVACSDHLERAYTWICEQRRERSHNNSVWDFRFNWQQLKLNIQRQLLAGEYTLSPLQSYTIDGMLVSSWTAMDSLVLKALTYTLQPLFSKEEYPHCTHLKEAGGIHEAVKRVSHNKLGYTHILKSDAYHYYESIDQGVLITAIKKYINCPGLIDLVLQYCQCVEIRDGNYFHFSQGIPKGCPVSPLIAALYLKPLDEALSQHGFYVRFMDDWLIMVKTKQQLRKIVKITHRILNQIKLKMHPDKTFIGCIKKGFDFLGIHFGEISEISKTSLENHRSKIAQRYVQGASSKCIGRYIERWTSCCKIL